MDTALETDRFHATLGVLLLLAKQRGTLSSAEMAELLQVHAVYLRKTISRLQKLGLVEAKEGRDGGYKLILPAADITLADAYEAIRHERKGSNGKGSRWFSLEPVLAEIERCSMTSLKKYSISDVMIE
ncbi:Rrf2 family transcriptional regulator [Paenibacillus spongiae]|uniref:Rrf2 family transcriptional regulator n=1 Tax=Paenibacillus spongiae TaxID=2909671 RepID=A0ABY5SH28_9BACL|nr:Rrf2 family transcriptional regulator [Paenibacillus spongiae]UVI33307.1 Rrf2 family transcriptional regulator [Paenibacillus spongiae]